uniref:Uncharacterized protein n=1 Tax=Aeromonas hydrophila TaxID=644 RepID=Q7BQE9_AERHY|nr:unknown [Aeromonas hydrophila]
MADYQTRALHICKQKLLIQWKLGSVLVPPPIRRGGRGKVRSAIRDDGADAAGTGMCRLRRSVRPCALPEENRVAVGLAGEKTFGDFGSFQSHSPKPEGRAKPLRGQRPRVLHGKAVPFPHHTVRTITPTG